MNDRLPKQDSGSDITYPMTAYSDRDSSLHPRSSYSPSVDALSPLSRHREKDMFDSDECDSLNEAEDVLDPFNQPAFSILLRAYDSLALNYSNPLIASFIDSAKKRLKPSDFFSGNTTMAKEDELFRTLHMAATDESTIHSMTSLIDLQNEESVAQFEDVLAAKKTLAYNMSLIFSEARRN
ncbi:hypothetical protein BLNAU_12944 [Blattamonas nauphoetae]|uniref:Uncharacterized protein n=1 Tax=Blattamonas nauphoetae TaxID=2049346 RepID=A0ABQ9XI27_9EUKA|nr:hypothetical protein BLNAU_12944 [Blattamonas nauphoetae]